MPAHTVRWACDSIETLAYSLRHSAVEGVQAWVEEGGYGLFRLTVSRLVADHTFEVVYPVDALLSSEQIDIELLYDALHAVLGEQDRKHRDIAQMQGLLEAGVEPWEIIKRMAAQRGQEQVQD